MFGSRGAAPTSVLLCVFGLWLITGCQAKEADASDWWTPVEPSVCAKTLHPTWDHPKRLNLSVPHSYSPKMVGLDFEPVHFPLRRCKTQPKNIRAVIQTTEKKWCWLKGRQFLYSKPDIWTNIDVTIITIKKLERNGWKRKTWWITIILKNSGEKSP